MTTGWNVTKVKRHLQWLREAGPKALIEEDNLDPREYATHVWRRLQYRRSNEAVPARALWVLGAQRSGTNMATKALAKHGGVHVYNENNRRAFVGFELRQAATVQALVSASRAPVVAFKPLCDSDRALELLGGFGGADSRTLWIHRGVDARSRSAVAKFGDTNLKMVRALVDGSDAGEWWSRSVSDEQRSLLRRLDAASLSAHDGSALFWWMRNSLYFSQRLDSCDAVKLVRYEDLLADPEGEVRAMCDHVGLVFDAQMIDHFEPYRTTGVTLDLNADVRELCDELGARLVPTR